MTATSTRLPAIALVCAVLLAGACFALLKSPGTPEPPDIARTGIDAALAVGVDAARTAVLASPKSASAWGQLGMLLLAHDYKAQAGMSFARAEAIDATNAEWPYLLGITMVDVQTELAVVKFQRAVELKGAEAGVDAMRLRWAEGLLALDRLDEAQAQFARVATAGAANARAQLGMGRVEMRRGDATKSLPYLEQARADPRTRKAALGLLAQAQQMLGQSDAATRWQRDAADAPDDAAWPDPSWSRVFALRTGKNADIARARELFLQDRLQEGIALAEKTARSYPDEPYVWFMLGKARYQSRELELAEQAFRRSLELEPKSVQATFLLGVVTGERGDLPAATKLFRTSTSLRPDFALGHYNLGLCLARQSDRKGAIESFRLAVKVDPGFAKAHLALAELLGADKLTADALVHAQQAANLRPDDVQTTQVLDALRKAGNGRAAPRR